MGTENSRVDNDSYNHVEGIGSLLHEQECTPLEKVTALTYLYFYHHKFIPWAAYNHIASGPNLARNSKR